ncbi:lysine-specific demethylase JMJ25 [Ananas comosus]|uniref:Lysine-specific demethylase JMJ25 n=1 Tax=Ananas comosus TaxID=4615 RepID=A0A6P5GHJ1_ANACO|nr:lysine-specific demethylase JMJ25 [Ananas comosus]XP_020108137.1 lysine-specific demethylase JMJ25 [Ananas comosus]
MEDNAGIPEDLRCKRSDGKQWRCSAPSMPDKTVCEKHYIQAKKRAANSALRASLKKARRKSLGDADADADADADIYLERKHGESGLTRSLSPVMKYKERMPKGVAAYSAGSMVMRGSLPHGGFNRPNDELPSDGTQAEENRARSVYSSPYSKEVKSFGATGAGEYFGRSADSYGAVKGLICHQCRRSDRVVWCISCERRGYCGVCISRWYAEIPLEEIRKVCPACRGICNCRICLRGDNLIKAKVQEIPGIDKLRYLHSLLVFVLPVLKQTYAEQCSEMGVETRIYGPKVDIPRAKVNADEQMCCDFCKIPVFDYHRHCTKCLYDLCLTCCRDIRRGSLISLEGGFVELQVPERSKDIDAATTRAEQYAKRTNDKSLSWIADENTIDFAHLFPAWKAKNDGSIPCGADAGGCGSSKLVLRRILKVNWIGKLVKNAEEMVKGCKVRDLDYSDRCSSCKGIRSLESKDSSDFSLFRCSNREGSSDNSLYCPMLDDVKHEGIGHFHKHWIKGEPVIIRHAFERSLASSWDPLSIWRGIQETTDEKINHDLIVKAVNCVNQSEVDIEMNKFIKGYSDGRILVDGRSLMLKLKDWPAPNILEEFLVCHRPEFLVNFPLVDFIHSKWGVLNLAAKLPHDTIQSEGAPKLLIAYGIHEELDRDYFVSNLQINMGDVAYMLMHTADVHSKSLKRCGTVQSEKISKEINAKRSTGTAHVSDNMYLDGKTHALDLTQREHREKENVFGFRYKEENIVENELCNGPEIASVEKRAYDSCRLERKRIDASDCSLGGAVWDVFRRQDVPKLNEYLRAHFMELKTTSPHSITHPVYDQAIVLSKDQKRMLKKEYGIEPWTFRQHVGEAVFIPAGCPFQVKFLLSSVQLVLDFLSPESLGESARMAQEIRCLPNDHDAKLKMFEVGKISLYAASSAIREIQKISVDPKLDSELRLQDHNLTAMVSENLDKIIKRRQVVCR